MQRSKHGEKNVGGEKEGLWKYISEICEVIYLRK